MKKILSLAACLLAGITNLNAGEPDPSNWDAVLEKAKGQKVFFHAWGGDDRINDYINWATKEVEERYGVSVTHAKVDDTANVVSTVLAEKTAGKNDGGSVDLVWINGENFANMKRNGLLLSKNWSEKLPSYAYADVENKPTLTTDFTVPVDGLQSPWGMAKMVFFHDSAVIEKVPSSTSGLLQWTKDNPGRFTYALPPNFIGTSFLKQLLIDLTSDGDALQKPADEADFAKVTAPLWAYLDEMNPNLWRKGKSFPQGTSAMRQLLADGEIDIYFAFNPSDASSAIAAGELPDTVRPFVFKEGTLGNTHFVAIPYNSSVKEGAMVLANFLLSPEAQARKQDPNVWGDPTVLSVSKLNDADKATFAALDLGIATPKPEELGRVLDEPHPSWVALIEAEWAKRYGAQ